MESRILITVSKWYEEQNQLAEQLQATLLQHHHQVAAIVADLLVYSNVCLQNAVMSFAL